MKKFMIFVLFIFTAVPAVRADEMGAEGLRLEVVQLKSAMQELRLIVDRQTQLIREQGSKIEQLEGGRSTTLSSPVAPAYTAPASVPMGRWNPEIGAVADIVTKSTNSAEDAEGEDRLSVRELEVMLGSNVDAYSRLDATIAFSDFEAASLEEAYLTRFELPWGFTGRVGKFKPQIGKAIPVHRDNLETIDEPLVIQRWFGAEGYNKAGADVTRILDLPFDSTHGISLGILEGGNGEGGTLFGAQRRPTVYSHLKNYWELGDASGLEWGILHMLGDKDGDSSFEVMVLGTDLTWISRFSESTALKIQGEALYQNRRNSEYEVPDDAGSTDIYRNDLDGTLWGGYGLVDLRFHPQWSAGFRGDYVELIDNAVTNPDLAEVAYSGYLTFYQSEFARWRTQVTHFAPVDGEDGDWQMMLQGTFVIGEHKHKIN